MRGIHQWPVDTPHQGQWHGALVFFICAWKKRLSEQSGGFETPSLPFWRHCNEQSDLQNTCCPLQWRHNGTDSVSNHQPHDCLPNRSFRRRSKKTSKLLVTGLCAGNSPGTGEFPAQNWQLREKCFHLMTSSCARRNNLSTAIRDTGYVMQNWFIMRLLHLKPLNYICALNHISMISSFGHVFVSYNV